MTYTRLRYHIVTATENRFPWITPDVEGVLYPILRIEAERQDSKIFVLGGIEDHVHWIIAIPPKHAVSNVVGRIKAGATKALHKHLPHLKDFKWQGGFGGFSLNPMDMSRAFDYVRNQKHHHQQGKLWHEYEKVDDLREKQENDAP